VLSIVPRIIQNLISIGLAIEYFLFTAFSTTPAAATAVDRESALVNFFPVNMRILNHVLVQGGL
jgi:hypothetical protein